MARIYTARQLLSGPNEGKWHYTVSSDEENWCHAVGYCAENCPGHDTSEEACDHYEQHLLDKRLRLEGSSDEEQRRCLICRVWTHEFAYFTGDSYRQFFLCPEHKTREFVAQLLKVRKESV